MARAVAFYGRKKHKHGEIDIKMLFDNWKEGCIKINLSRKITGLIAGLMIGLSFWSMNEANAYREPEFTTNLGGLPISCSIYAEQARIGNIHTGDSPETVKACYGVPKRISNENGIRYYYDGMVLTFIDYSGENKPILADIRVIKNMEPSNNATPAGVAVGMSEFVLTSAYSTADEVYIEKHTAPKLSEEQNQKYDERLNKTTYTYNASACLSMSFIVRNGIIQEIRIHLSD